MAFLIEDCPDAEYLGEWIDSEGGVSEFFLTQISTARIEHPGLKQLVEEFQDRYDRILDFLVESGVEI